LLGLSPVGPKRVTQGLLGRLVGLLDHLLSRLRRLVKHLLGRLLGLIAAGQGQQRHPHDQRSTH